MKADARILVIAVARIGDTLLATPVMRAAKAAHPGGVLTVLAHPGRVEVLAGLPFIDRLGSIDKRRAPWKGWIGSRLHDSALVFGRDPGLVAYALRVADRVVAFDQPGLPADARLVRVAPQAGTHAVDERLRLATAAGIGVADRRLAYQVTPGERAAAMARLQARWPAEPGGGSAQPLVALQMCSFPTKSHRDWPVESFIALAERLNEEREARFLVLGDAAARRAAAPFLARHAARTWVAAGETSLRESAALISLADLYVGVDTGPTHIAGALGVPMVALYHCDYPGRNLVPLDHPRLRMIEHPATGSRACSDAHMGDIPVERVLQAAQELLAVPQAAGVTA